MKFATYTLPIMKGVEAIMLNMNAINQVIKYPKLIGCAAMGAGIVVAAQPVVEEKKSGSEWLIGMVDQILEEQKKKAIEDEKKWKEAAKAFELEVDKYEAICKKDMHNFKLHKIYENLVKKQKQQQQKQHHHHH